MVTLFLLKDSLIRKIKIYLKTYIFSVSYCWGRVVHLHGRPRPGNDPGSHQLPARSDSRHWRGVWRHVRAAGPRSHPRLLDQAQWEASGCSVLICQNIKNCQAQVQSQFQVPNPSPKSKSKIQVQNPSPRSRSQIQVPNPKSKVQRKGTGTGADTIILQATHHHHHP